MKMCVTILLISEYAHDGDDNDDNAVLALKNHCHRCEGKQCLPIVHTQTPGDIFNRWARKWALISANFFLSFSLQ